MCHGYRHVHHHEGRQQQTFKRHRQPGRVPLRCSASVAMTVARQPARKNTGMARSFTRIALFVGDELSAGQHETAGQLRDEKSRKGRGM